MDNPKGKGESNPNVFDGEDNELDLTLKLGRSSVQYNENEEHQTNWNDGYSTLVPYEDGSLEVAVPYEVGSSAVASYATSGYVVYHQSVFPHNPPITPTRKRSNADTTKTCKICGSNTTPLWRKGPDGPQTLCNACGLRHLRTIKRGGGK